MAEPTISSTYTLPKLGITVRFVDMSDPANVEKAIDDKTRLVFSESIGNPKNNVDDFEAIAAVAHKHGIPYIVDNTVAPLILNPFRAWGGHRGVFADEIHRRTWNLAGRGNCGLRQVQLEGIRQIPRNHGAGSLIPWVGVLGTLSAYMTRRWCPARRLSSRRGLQLLRDTGACISPFNSFLILQGLETLHLRMPRHCENALKIAQFLEANPNVAWVVYPGLKSHKDHANALKYLSKGFGGIIGFGIKGGLAAGVKVIESVKLFSHLANIGRCKKPDYSSGLHHASAALA